MKRGAAAACVLALLVAFVPAAGGAHSLTTCTASAVATVPGYLSASCSIDYVCDVHYHQHGRCLWFLNGSVQGAGQVAMTVTSTQAFSPYTQSCTGGVGLSSCTTPDLLADSYYLGVETITCVATGVAVNVTMTCRAKPGN